MKTFDSNGDFFMKRFLSFFYTNSFKGLLFILILLFSFLSSEYTLKTALLYKEDPIALLNVFRQKGDFDFQSSLYLENSVEIVIHEVLFSSLTDSKDTREYYEVNKKLQNYNELSFAVVNHATKRISSNVKNLNSKSSSAEIRKHFPDNEKSLLIVYNAKNPYYESGTLTNYVSVVNKLSKDYDDNFDIYIYFGENFAFAGDESLFSQRDSAMFSKVSSTLTYALLFLVMGVVLFIILFILTGKKEFGGRQYLSTFDKIPNDFLISMYLIIIVCTLSLYSTSVQMLIKTTYYESYWLNFKPDFYILRGNFCSLFLSLTFMLLSFTLKRQYKNNSLLKNTYIYNLIFSYKSSGNKE